MKRQFPRRGEDLDWAEEFQPFAELKPSRVIARNVKQNEYLYPLDYELEEFKDIDDLIKLLARAEYGDKVVIFINSGGGRVDMADLICNRIKEAQSRGVQVIGELGFNVASATTFVALACDDIVVSDGCNFMIHLWEGGLSEADATKQLKRTLFDNKQSSEFMRRVYKGFLTDEEIEEIISHPTEIYMGAEEVRLRWKNKIGTEDQNDKGSFEAFVNEKIDAKLMELGIIPKPKKTKRK